jgi:hypothetical protein
MYLGMHRVSTGNIVSKIARFFYRKGSFCRTGLIQESRTDRLGLKRIANSSAKVSSSLKQYHPPFKTGEHCRSVTVNAPQHAGQAC